MQNLLLHAQAQLADALRLVEAALRAPTPERAGNLAHDADLRSLAAADTLSRAFEAAAGMADLYRLSEGAESGVAGGAGRLGDGTTSQVRTEDLQSHNLEGDK